MLILVIISITNNIISDSETDLPVWVAPKFLNKGLQYKRKKKDIFIGIPMSEGQVTWHLAQCIHVMRQSRPSIST